MPVLLVIAFCLAVLACEKGVSETKPPAAEKATATPDTTPFIPQDGDYEATGEVTKINDELGSIELDHDEIKDLMPRMKMEFFVRDKALLKGLKVGDRVRFFIQYKHPQEIITSIKKAQ